MNTITTNFRNGAVLLKKQGKYEESDALFLKALAIFEAALGVGHPKVDPCRKKNAALLRRMKGRSDFAAAAARCAEGLRPSGIDFLLIGLCAESQ